MLLLYSSNQVQVYRCSCSLVSVPGVAQCPQGVLRALLGWQLVGTSLLRNWMSLINPLQTSVEVHCPSQLVRKILLSHVLTTPGWGFLQSFHPLWCREERAELSPKQREAEGPQLLLHPPLMSSAGESPPLSPPCTMQRPPESLGIVHLPAGSPCSFGLPQGAVGAS